MADRRRSLYVRSPTLFKLGIVLPVVVLLAIHGALLPASILDPKVLFWTLMVAAAELLPLPEWKGVTLSLGFPILLAVMILYPPLTAGTVALVGDFDRREFQRGFSRMSALFNRCQIALSVLVGSAVLHAIASSPRLAPWYELVPAVVLGKVADYLVNVVLVAVAFRLTYLIPFREALTRLRVGTAAEFLFNYLGLSLFGLVIAKLYWISPQGNLWVVVAFIAPVVFARQMFFRTIALEQASRELQDRERVLRALSNRMAEERQDERLQIAQLLHDDLGQTLFQLTLRLEMAKKRLSQRDLPGVDKDLESIREIQQRTSRMLRSLVRDLHHAPIGRTGLPDALSSLGSEMGKAANVEIAVDVEQVVLPPPIQLLIYQIAREAVLNALKHAEPKHIWIDLHESDEGVDVQIRDDGTGFDTRAPAPEGHFGSVMMRERALVAGGSFEMRSRPGEGTEVLARFPRVWVEEATEQAGLHIPSVDTPAVAPPEATAAEQTSVDHAPDALTPDPTPAPRPGPRGTATPPEPLTA